MAHDLLTPSAYACWGNCPAAPHYYKDIPNESSQFADEGTAAHALAHQAAEAYMGHEMALDAETEQLVKQYADEYMHSAADRWAQLTTARINCINCDRAHAFFGYEDAVDISGITHREGASGTVDFWCLHQEDDGRKILEVWDFKYGMGVLVDPSHNGQLSIYAAALLLRARSNHLWRADGVRLVIFQPRMASEPTEWEPIPAEFNEFVMNPETGITAKAKRCIQIMNEAASGSLNPEQYLVPGEAQCRFCRAKATCPALAKQVAASVSADFEVLPAAETEQALTVPEEAAQLARALPWLETIENWCDAVRAAAKARLERGESIPGYKLVAGRKGPRKWTDEAEEILKGMRINKSVLYVEKLISPTAAEKAAKKGDIGPRQWAKIKELITQSEGNPAIAPESDPRPAICVSVADDFDELPASETEQATEALPSPAPAEAVSELVADPAPAAVPASEEDDLDFI
jgi:hypothetical protein